MDNFTLHKDFLGTKQNLSVEGGSFKWTNDIGEWVLSKSDNLEYLNILKWADDVGLDFDVSFPHKYLKAFEHVGYDLSKPIPYHHVAPKCVYDRWLQKTLESCRIALNNANDNLYLPQFKRYRRLISSIKRCYVSPDEIRSLSEETDSNTQKSLLASFEHDKHGFCRLKPMYKRIPTGRLKVTSGPNILSLKKEYRSILKSRYKKGRIVMLDFQSLEPRVAYAIANPEFKDMPEDIYRFINKEILHKDIKRSDLKTAIMASLYGMSTRNLASRLGSAEEAYDLKAAITKTFRVKEVYQTLKESVCNSILLNNHGWAMRISKETPLYSHYIQSSASDVCVEGFANICDFIQESNLNMQPIFLLHDSIFLDVDPSCASDLDKVAEQGTKISNYNIRFPIKISLVQQPKN